tara:strand:+ start:2433 stop:3578 length:1146 start_codon:yes stop_codon:yes gene_type:complete
MKAVVYKGPKEVAVEEVPDAKIERPTDVVVKITTTNICGSDLHMYEGRTDLQTGSVIGHENMGEVVEVGGGVERIRVGDHVSLPFNIGCGFCRNCEAGNTAFCLTVHPDPNMAGAAYGFAGMGPFAGGQAEYLRVPFADFNCLRLPEDASEKQNDYALVSDVFPTGWHATEMADLQPGESVVIYGGGAVGLMAAYSAILKSASLVMLVDREPDRLKLAKQMGAIPIDDSKGDSVNQILELTNGLGADKGCECVGYQCCNHHGQEQPNLTLNNLVASVRFTGKIGTVGIFLPHDPGADSEMHRQGRIAFDMGKFWFKGQKMGCGQANVKRYNRQLRDLIHRDVAKPSFIISHEMALADAPEGYRRFDAHEPGYTKILLKPAA